MLSISNHDQLRQYIAKINGVAIAPVVHGKIPFERRRVFDRYQAVLFALWLLADSETRIRQAWQAKAVRFNLLLRDFKDGPKWFVDLAEQLNRMRFPAIYDKKVGLKKVID
jgi:hypothetical protein